MKMIVLCSIYNVFNEKVNVQNKVPRTPYRYVIILEHILPYTW